MGHVPVRGNISLDRQGFRRRIFRDPVRKFRTPLSTLNSRNLSIHRSSLLPGVSDEGDGDRRCHSILVSSEPRLLVGTQASRWLGRSVLCHRLLAGISHITSWVLCGRHPGACLCPVTNRPSRCSRLFPRADIGRLSPYAAFHVVRCIIGSAFSLCICVLHMRASGATVGADRRTHIPSSGALMAAFEAARCQQTTVSCCSQVDTIELLAISLSTPRRLTCRRGRHPSYHSTLTLWLLFHFAGQQEYRDVAFLFLQVRPRSVKRNLVPPHKWSLDNTACS